MGRLGRRRLLCRVRHEKCAYFAYRFSNQRRTVYGASHRTAMRCRPRQGCFRKKCTNETRTLDTALTVVLFARRHTEKLCVGGREPATEQAPAGRPCELHPVIYFNAV